MKKAEENTRRLYKAGGSIFFMGLALFFVRIVSDFDFVEEFFMINTLIILSYLHFEKQNTKRFVLMLCLSLLIWWFYTALPDNVFLFMFVSIFSLFVYPVMAGRIVGNKLYERKYK